LAQVRAAKDYDDWLVKVMGPILANTRAYLVNSGILALQTEKGAREKRRWIDYVNSLGFFKLVTATLQGKNSEYSKFSKRDQTLLIFDAC
jgi:hypothetical protein